jgi:hypothetical protein
MEIPYVTEKLKDYDRYIKENQTNSKIPQRQNASFIVECDYCENEYDGTDFYCCYECDEKFRTALFMFTLLNNNKLTNHIPPEIWINIISYLTPTKK